MTKCPSRACICVALALWVCIGITFSAVVVVIYLLPMWKIARMKRATCHVENFFFTSQFVCPCLQLDFYISEKIGEVYEQPNHQLNKCPLYPCFIVHVAVTFGAENDSLAASSTLSNEHHRPEEDKRLTIMFSDDRQQTLATDSDDEQRELCSIRTCDLQTEVEMRRAVENFAKVYGVKNKKVPCFIDPWNPNKGAVIQIVSMDSSAFHWIGWPFLSLVSSLLSCYLFCRYCQKNSGWRREVEKTVENGGPLSSSLEMHQVPKPQSKPLGLSLRRLWMD